MLYGPVPHCSPNVIVLFVAVRPLPPNPWMPSECGSGNGLSQSPVMPPTMWTKLSSIVTGPQPPSRNPSPRLTISTPPGGIAAIGHRGEVVGERLAGLRLERGVLDQQVGAADGVVRLVRQVDVVLDEPAFELDAADGHVVGIPLQQQIRAVVKRMSSTVWFGSVMVRSFARVTAGLQPAGYARCGTIGVLERILGMGPCASLGRHRVIGGPFSVAISRRRRIVTSGDDQHADGADAQSDGDEHGPEGPRQP